MRITTARALAAGIVPIVLLTGCGSDKKSTSPSSSTSAKPYTVPANQVSAMSTITVDNKNPKAPKVGLTKKPFHVNKTTTEVLTQGTGATVGPNDIAYIEYTAIDGTTGKSLVNNFGKQPFGVKVDDPQQFPGLVKALKGAKVGTVQKVAVPPSDGFGTSGSQELGVAPTSSIIFYLKIDNAAPVLKEATGKAVTPPADLPKVSVPKNNAKPATVTIPKGKDNKPAKAPTKLVSQELIQGTGMQVKENQNVMVAYTGLIWGTGKVFDSSASRGEPATFPLSKQGMIPGFIKGLVGKKVGSRVLLVLPPSEGYGAAGQPQAGIKGTDTLVFVVDILAIA
ncbi:FKBP-type peptidyl-prolyl cis-trans isomerase [Calidifontibacter sp. DB0510]|uniref:peptidylprolyl isomerase n=1 Tax=Metallococcus carri TaxID=1656884 RepID=A0A967AYK5_9MICO|nr:FKBP-type peptidyl-prolyl cis-trans isomerase [Metallococcus carri]NHN54804.1 FKBP-type peptidyl-prolyl cis-trans isomerase [Metallococcus carri]NOP37149.1 hypothetical protein [Calidifontibacter sp. DB2511S]